MACMRRRLHTASTRRCLPTRWSVKRRLFAGSATWRGRGRCSMRQAATTETWTYPPARPPCSLAWRGGSQRGQGRRRDGLCRGRLPGRRRQRGLGNTTARRDRRSRGQGARRPDPPQRRGLGRACSAARPEFVVPQSHQFHRRAGCHRARGPPRASGSLRGRGLGGDGRRGPVRHLPEALGATRYEPEVAAADFLVAVDLSVTSASPQASQASWDSCSQHKVSPSASMITWTPPGLPLKTTAARSPQARGPRRGTSRHSEPSTTAGPPQRCASPSKPTRSSSSPSPTSTP